MLEARAYTDAASNTPFEKWHDKLDGRAVAKVRVALTRVRQGNTSNVASVGGGVFEIKIDFGPGYRVYFSRPGGGLILLLGGGIKKRQSADINAAKAHWADYKRERV